MNDIILEGICEILSSRRKLLRIAMRQKAKFEGWLKFELASFLENRSYHHVEVEKKSDHSTARCDITFYDGNNNFFRLELKTSNTNWDIPGIRPGGKALTKNIRSIIDDCIKLNSLTGIVAFVLFPIPTSDTRWEM